MCKLEGFLFLYTLQVGVATICSWGLGLMAIAVIANISTLFSSLAYADLYDSITFEQMCVHYVVFFVFIVVGFMTYIFGMAGAYQESVFPMKVAVGLLLSHALIWVILTILTTSSSDLTKYTLSY